MANFYPAIELIGGAEGALDAISHLDPKGDDSVALITGDVCIVVTESHSYTYRYDSSSSAVEDSPKIIAPDSGGGRWILVEYIPIFYGRDTVRSGFILAIQRGLNVGYNRASHLLEAIIEEGFITIVENGKDQWRYRIM
jgi:hypothetical protein